MFIQPFPKLENTIAPDENSSILNDQVAGLSESSSSEHGIRRLRRKLLLDLEFDVEDVDGAAHKMFDAPAADLVADLMIDGKHNLNEPFTEADDMNAEDAELVADDVKAEKVDEIVAPPDLDSVGHVEIVSVASEDENMCAFNVIAEDISVVGA